jgi:hypothetical protein
MIGLLPMYSGLSARVRRAFRHSFFGIWTIALTYGVSVLIGMLLVHSGNHYALDVRDRMVLKATKESVIFRQMDRGNFAAAAGLDATGNAVAGFLSLVAGYGVPAGYGVAAYRGWIGGIVSVDTAHRSRLTRPGPAFYYLTTLLLQLIPYSLAGGAGVSIGIAAFARADQTRYPGPRMRFLHIPYEAIWDAAWIFLISIPLFAIASLFEFMI